MAPLPPRSGSFFCNGRQAGHNRRPLLTVCAGHAVDIIAENTSGPAIRHFQLLSNAGHVHREPHFGVTGHAIGAPGTVSRPAQTDTFGVASIPGHGPGLTVVRDIFTTAIALPKQGL